MRALVRNVIEQHLRHEPTKASKSRIKRLRGFFRPQYRLRASDDVRVYYDVIDKTFELLAIGLKSEAKAWLEKHGESDETDCSV